MFSVYKITNKINGKSYIGISSREPIMRWSEHLVRYRQGRRGGNRLYDALSKYGPNAFSLETVATASTELEIRKLETFYITKFDTYHNGYNCNLGGVGFLKFPKHIVRKISEAQKGKIISAETKAKMSLAKLGDKRCAEHFGEHLSKGGNNPRARWFLIRFPDGTEHKICGLREFCRLHEIAHSKLSAKGRTKGYMLLKRLNDYPEMEYSQAAGNGGSPVAVGTKI